MVLVRLTVPLAGVLVEIAIQFVEIKLVDI